jgi:predicted nuclease of predicted toxin-antitoxin system
MAKIYADEQFPRPVVELLRELGHDVLTVKESGNDGFADPEVLEFAMANDRIVLTQNRRDFKKIHQFTPNHCGIIVCTEDRNSSELTARIHNAILAEDLFSGKIVSVVRPAN